MDIKNINKAKDIIKEIENAEYGIERLKKFIKTDLYITNSYDDSYRLDSEIAGKILDLIIEDKKNKIKKYKKSLEDL